MSNSCPHGDPTCPCQDGDVCHYVDDPRTDTKAMTPPDPAVPVILGTLAAVAQAKAKRRRR